MAIVDPAPQMNQILDAGVPCQASALKNLHLYNDQEKQIHGEAFKKQMEEFYTNPPVIDHGQPIVAQRRTGDYSKFKSLLGGLIPKNVHDADSRRKWKTCKSFVSVASIREADLDEQAKNLISNVLTGNPVKYDQLPAAITGGKLLRGHFLMDLAWAFVDNWLDGLSMTSLTSLGGLWKGYRYGKKQKYISYIKR